MHKTPPIKSMGKILGEESWKVIATLNGLEDKMQR